MWTPFLVEMMERLSPLYHHLSRQMEHDPELLALERLVERHQPCPITFFAAVNALLLRDHTHPLTKYYPSLTAVPHPASEAYPAFRQFCLSHREELQQMLPQMQLQTNEITRCANWLPALEIVSRRGGRKPLSLVELGCSAGLNLLVDHYSYRYRPSNGPVWHIGAGPILLDCVLEGELLPPVPLEVPPIAQRLGIDLSPLSLDNASHVHLLLGAIWPEERFRFVILKQAIALARTIPRPLFRGDAALLLPRVLEAIPSEQTACLVHSYALRQGDPSVRSRVEETLIEASQRRPVWRISLEIEQGEWDAPRLELFSYDGGVVRQEWLATCQVHGDAMRWRVPAEQLV
jgi:hypothetical protein